MDSRIRAAHRGVQTEAQEHREGVRTADQGVVRVQVDQTDTNLLNTLPIPIAAATNSFIDIVASSPPFYYFCFSHYQSDT